jgi:hypothetical protein
MRKILSRITLVIIYLAALAILAMGFFPAFASATDPTVDVVSADAYRNIYDTGDTVIVAYYQLADWTSDYGLARLFNGTTKLQERDIYYSDGEYALTAFLFTPGDASISWGSSLMVSIEGNPSSFTEPPVGSYNMTGSNWHASASTTQGRSQLNSKLVNRLNLIETDSPTIADDDLIHRGASGWIATQDGASMLLTALPGLYTPLPKIFPSMQEQMAFLQETQGKALEDAFETEAQSGSLKPALQKIGNAFGLGNWFVVGLGLSLYVAGVIVCIKQGVPALAATGTASPLLLVSMRGALIPMAWPALAIFLMWFVGLWRMIRPTRETLVTFGTAMYVIGIILGAIMDMTNVSSGAVGVLNNLFQLNIFNQEDPSILGYIIALPVSGLQFLHGLFNIAFWNFGFWNDLGIIKWIIWLPFFGGFVYNILSTIWSRR